MIERTSWWFISTVKESSHIRLAQIREEHSIHPFAYSNYRSLCQSICRLICDDMQLFLWGGKTWVHRSWADDKCMVRTLDCFNNNHNRLMFINKIFIKNHASYIFSTLIFYNNSWRKCLLDEMWVSIYRWSQWIVTLITTGHVGGSSSQP